MQIKDVLARVDEVKANDWSKELKLSWLSEIEHQVKAEVFDTHYMNEKDTARAAAFAGYNAETPEETELLVPEPYSTLYQYYIEAQIARADGDKSQNHDATPLFDNMYLTYRRYVNRTQMPKKQLRAFLI